MKVSEQSKWINGNLSDIADITMGQSPPGNSYNDLKNGIGLINGPTEFTNKYPVVKQWTSKPTKLCKAGDILLCVRGSSTGRMNIADDEYCIGRGVASIRAKKDKAETSFIYYTLNYKVNQLLQKTAGSTFPNLSSNEIKDMIVGIPLFTEQQKIASILSTWDKAIELKEKLIEQKKEQKKGLMQKLLTGEMRLPGYEEPIRKRRLKGCIGEVKVRNKSKQVNRVLSVTNSRGFIEQSEQFDRQVASQDLTSYKIVTKGQFAYNPSRINVGSIDLLSDFDSGLLSPMYVVFKVNNEIIYEDYLYHFVKSPLFLNQMGSLLEGSVRHSLSFGALEQIKLFLPKINEQKEIAKILNTLDKEIELIQKEFESLKMQKQGLMQLLLTGKVRVKV